MAQVRPKRNTRRRAAYPRREQALDDLITRIIDLHPKERREVIDTVLLMEAAAAMRYRRRGRRYKDGR